MDRAVAFFRDGTSEFEEIARHATSHLVYVFHIERAEAKVGESDELSRITLRVTMIAAKTTAGRWFFARQTRSS
jgi:ketosteroid isomerase-like protein